MSPPIRDGSGNSIGAIRLGDGTEISEVRTGAGDVLFSGILDSEANQKLVHRWPLSEDSDPFVDQIGSSDGTNNGKTQVTGNKYVDGAARQGDGTGDYIDVGQSAPSLDARFAVAVTLDNFTSSSRGTMVGVLNTGDNQRLDLAVSFSSTGDVAFDATGADADTVRVLTGGGVVDDGNRHRIVYNKTGPTASEFEIWIDGTEQGTSIDVDQGGGVNTFNGWDTATHLFNRGGLNDFHLPAIQDDVCFFGDSLTQSEIQSYELP